jgi:tight adherence protein B
MDPVFIAAAVGVVAYVLVVACIPKHYLSKADAYQRSMLQQLEDQAQGTSGLRDDSSVLREAIENSGVLSRAFLMLPGAKSAYPKLVRAGMSGSLEKITLAGIVVFLCLVLLFRGLSFYSVPLAVIATWMIMGMYVVMKLKKRSEQFMLLFPDALEMIVRSIRSGYPMNAAIRMVADNMQAPLSDEFRQVADETTYGSSLIESLQRMSKRIDQADVHFFVIVLTVQQEVGGNLAEVLSNLASIIRKRRHLVMKVRALTSEGRATAWILGLLPVFVFSMIYMTSPNHLKPLFETGMGRMILATAVGILFLGGMIIRSMVRVKV